VRAVLKRHGDIAVESIARNHPYQAAVRSDDVVDEAIGTTVTLDLTDRSLADWPDVTAARPRISENTGPLQTLALHGCF